MKRALLFSLAASLAIMPRPAVADEDPCYAAVRDYALGRPADPVETCRDRAEQTAASAETSSYVVLASLPEPHQPFCVPDTDLEAYRVSTTGTPAVSSNQVSCQVPTTVGGATSAARTPRGWRNTPYHWSWYDIGALVEYRNGQRTEYGKVEIWADIVLIDRTIEWYFQMRRFSGSNILSYNSVNCVRQRTGPNTSCSGGWRYWQYNVYDPTLQERPEWTTTFTSAGTYWIDFDFGAYISSRPYPFDASGTSAKLGCPVNNGDCYFPDPQDN